MGKRSARMDLWFFFLIFLPASKTSSLDDAMDCTVDTMRIDCSKEGVSRSLFCDQKMSQQCETDGMERSTKCHDTLGEDFDVCTVAEFQEDEGCHSIKPSRITAPNESLVDLHLYHHKNWGDEALVNVTLPASAWKELRLQYTFIDSGFRDACRRFIIHERLNSTLMYECRVMNKVGDTYMSTKLTVESDSGEGASYLFMIPSGLKIHPEKTCPSDWHVFFYIHLDALQQYDPLPVTVQSSPFGQVTYRMVLARCLDPEDEECRDFEELDHKLETKNTTDDLWITYLSEVTTGGTYTVRVQMVSDWCPKPKGCHVSVSPRFEVPSLPWIVFLLTICMILMFLASIVIMFCYRQKINREFFKGLKNKQPTVLLVYHPESQAALSFVKTIAEFLKNTCCVTSLMADLEVGTENPTNWTKTQMNDANRVLFIIPKDSEAQSFTPIRNQWKVALNHCIGHEFITSQEHVKRLAKLVHPASGNVPCEVSEEERLNIEQQ